MGITETMDTRRLLLLHLYRHRSEHGTDDTHYHVSAGGEVKGVSSHKHPDDNDGGFVGHAHDK